MSDACFDQLEMAGIARDRCNPFTAFHPADVTHGINAILDIERAYGICIAAIDSIAVAPGSRRSPEPLVNVVAIPPPAETKKP